MEEILKLLQENPDKVKEIFAMFSKDKKDSTENPIMGPGLLIGIFFALTLFFMSRSDNRPHYPMDEYITDMKIKKAVEEAFEKHKQEN